MVEQITYSIFIVFNVFTGLLNQNSLALAYEHMSDDPHF